MNFISQRMDPDFQNLKADNSSLFADDIVHPTNKLILIKIPKDVNMEILNKINIKPGFGKIGEVSDGMFEYEILKSKGSLESDIRPLIYKNQNDNTTSIGPRFDGTVTLVRNCLPHKTLSSNEDIRPSYTKLSQLPDLTVRFLPQGSFTSLEEFQKRLKFRNKKLKQGNMSDSTAGIAQTPTKAGRDKQNNKVSNNEKMHENKVEESTPKKKRKKSEGRHEDIAEGRKSKNVVKQM